MLSTHHSLTKDVLERNKAMNWLLDTFPKAFDLCNRKPLKNNILEDILALALPAIPAKKALTEAFNYYTQWGSYLSALQSGAPCFDLNGKAAGTISVEEAQKAQEAIRLAEKKVNGL